MKSPCTALAAIALAFTASQPAAAASDNVAPLLPLSLEELFLAVAGEEKGAAR